MATVLLRIVHRFPPGCGPNAPRIGVSNAAESILETEGKLTHELPRSKDLETAKGSDEACIGSSILDPTSPSGLNSNILSTNLNRNYPPRRKISAIRDFPPLCGRDTSLVTRAECIKVRSSTESVLPQGDYSSLSGKSESEKKTVASNLKLDGFVGGAEIRNEIVVYDPEKQGTEILHKDGAGKEIVVPSEAYESKGTHPYLSGMSEFSCEHRGSNVLVHALMAAPNCPWRQSKGTNLTSHCGFQKPRGLKHGSSSGTKKSNGKKLLEERRARIAGSNKKKARPNYIVATPLRSSHPYATVIERDDFYVGPSTCEIDLPPLVPNKIKMQKDSNVHGSYNKVRRTLRLFQAVYRKFTREMKKP